MDTQSKVASPGEATPSVAPSAPKPNSPRCRPQAASRAQYLLTPRAYEEIYHEQAYLGTYLQQKTTRMEGLIREYAESEAELSRGAEGKTRRRLRKMLHLLRCKIDETSEQEHAIFSRIGELYMELNSRNTLELVRQQQQQRQASIAATAMQINGVGGGAACWPAVMAVPTSDHERSSTIWTTPCPSLDSGEVSATSSLMPESPVFFPSRAMANAFARQDSDGEAETLPLRFGSSEQLETVPEEARAEVGLLCVQTNFATPPKDIEDVLRTPVQKDYARGEGNFEDVDRTPIQRDFTAQQDAAAGGQTCEYSSPQGSSTYDDDDDYDDYDDDYVGSDEDDDIFAAAAREKAKKRWSLPVMQFTWPET